MKLFYEGKDISDDISIRSAKVIDRAGEKLDVIELEVNNPENEWSEWELKKNHQVIIEQDGFSSGVMYIQSIRQLKSTVKIICLPIKEESKEKYTKSWENVTIMELLNEIATKHGLKLKAYNLTNHRYRFISQVDESDFVFLHHRCSLEGYVMKVTDNCLVVYDERWMETQGPIPIEYSEVVGEFTYNEGATKVYGSAKVGEHLFISPDHKGPVLLVDAIASSIGEADRFAKNSLRALNKYENRMQFSIKFNPGIAAGCMVEAKGFGMGDHLYYTYTVEQNPTQDITTLMLRTVPRW